MGRRLRTELTLYVAILKVFMVPSLAVMRSREYHRFWLIRKSEFCYYCSIQPYQRIVMPDLIRHLALFCGFPHTRE